MVSGGPLRMTCHSKGLLSSTKPAEKPESVFLFRSAQPHQHQQAAIRPRQAGTDDNKSKNQKSSPRIYKERSPQHREKTCVLDAVNPNSHRKTADASFCYTSDTTATAPNSPTPPHAQEHATTYPSAAASTAATPDREPKPTPPP